jgi:hypothetical protein
MGQVSDKLEKELRRKISLLRLTHTGLFIKLDIDPEYSNLRRYIKMHRAVLDRALIDWFHCKKEIKSQVDSWLDLYNPDFQDACERALLKPEDVLEVFHTVKRLLDGKNNKFKKVGNAKKRRKKL